jgi:aspartate-semialdehyde dehydrogenase
MSYRIGIIGARGNIGQKVVQQLLEKGIPSDNLILAASEPSFLFYQEKKFTLYTPETMPKCSLYILATPSEISQQLAPQFLKQNAFVLDSSSAFRLMPDVPLLAPLINNHLINDKTKLYAHANCIASPLSLILFPLLSFDPIGLFLSTYQAASGAGWKATQELLNSTTAHLNQKSHPSVHFVKPIAFNLFPEIGTYSGDERPTGEEEKIVQETQKILGINIPICVTAVRVPVLRGHSMSIWIQFKDQICLAQAQSKLAKSPGIIIAEKGYSTPMDIIDSDNVVLGRIHRPFPDRLHIWACSDNLRRGAATDLVETAFYLIDNVFLLNEHRQPISCQTSPMQKAHFNLL